MPEENEFRFKSKTPSRRMYELNENTKQEIIKQHVALLPDSERAKLKQEPKKDPLFKTVDCGKNFTRFLVSYQGANNDFKPSMRTGLPSPDT